MRLAQKCLYYFILVAFSGIGSAADVEPLGVPLCDYSISARSFDQYVDLIGCSAQDFRTEVLDVGCGRGNFVVNCNNRGIACIGLDPQIDPFYHTRYPGWFINGRVEDLLEIFPEKRFSTVVSCKSVFAYNITNSKYCSMALDRIKSVLKPGGLILIDSPLNESLNEALRSHPDLCATPFAKGGVRIVYTPPPPTATGTICTQVSNCAPLTLEMVESVAKTNSGISSAIAPRPRARGRFNFRLGVKFGSYAGAVSPEDCVKLVSSLAGHGDSTAGYNLTKDTRCRSNLVTVPQWYPWMDQETCDTRPYAYSHTGEKIFMIRCSDGYFHDVHSAIAIEEALRRSEEEMVERLRWEQLYCPQVKTANN